MKKFTRIGHKLKTGVKDTFGISDEHEKKLLEKLANAKETVGKVTDEAKRIGKIGKNIAIDAGKKFINEVRNRRDERNTEIGDNGGSGGHHRQENPSRTQQQTAQHVTSSDLKPAFINAHNKWRGAEGVGLANVVSQRFRNTRFTPFSKFNS